MCMLKLRGVVPTCRSSMSSRHLQDRSIRTNPGGVRTQKYTPRSIDFTMCRHDYDAEYANAKVLKKFGMKRMANFHIARVPQQGSVQSKSTLRTTGV